MDRRSCASAACCLMRPALRNGFGKPTVKPWTMPCCGPANSSTAKPSQSSWLGSGAYRSSPPGRGWVRRQAQCHPTAHACAANGRNGLAARRARVQPGANRYSARSAGGVIRCHLLTLEQSLPGAFRSEPFRSNPICTASWLVCRDGRPNCRPARPPGPTVRNPAAGDALGPARRGAPGR
jgi:hypothetical protein